jgi:hypothetical protein
VLNGGVYPIDDSVAPTGLRQRRTALTYWSCVSYALAVLALDVEVLNRHKHFDEDHLQAIIDGLPDLLLVGRWDNGARSYSIYTTS